MITLNTHFKDISSSLPSHFLKQVVQTKIPTFFPSSLVISHILFHILLVQMYFIFLYAECATLQASTFFMSQCYAEYSL